jgi:crotonobetainyl-CoA:carnitine CoA-transferase CaiB-like acyl-CoA transferase
MSLPLDGIRVIDLGQVYAAPYCTLQLAAMGADIIKIEPPVTGEVLRRPELPPGGAGYSFLMLNANKRSVTINLKDRRGQEIVLKLLEDADVLVENYLDGVMESFGLAYDQIAERFPRLIYASGKGYGSDSRYAKLGSMDNTIQASSGFISITGFPEHPVKTSATFIDMGTGSHMVSGILAALIHRGKTGRGQHVEVAMLDSSVDQRRRSCPAGDEVQAAGKSSLGRMPDQHLSRARRRDSDFLPDGSTLAHAGEIDGPRRASRRPAMQKSRRAPEDRRRTGRARLRMDQRASARRDG